MFKTVLVLALAVVGTQAAGHTEGEHSHECAHYINAYSTKDCSGALDRDKTTYINNNIMRGVGDGCFYYGYYRYGLGAYTYYSYRINCEDGGEPEVIWFNKKDCSTLAPL